MHFGLNRRNFLQGISSIPLLSPFLQSTQAATQQPDTQQVRIAAIGSTYHPDSHADVFLTRLLKPYRLNRKLQIPRVQVVSLFFDESPENDISREVASEFEIPIYATVSEALRCGGNRLAVDGVAHIFEQGSYPRNDRGQKLYPRYEFFNKIVDVMREDKKVVPVWVDKHFSYDWSKAKRMYQTALEMKIPLMAGSTVSLTNRYPPLQLNGDIELEEAMVIGFGQTDDYGFHALEALQAIVERRRGGENGVASVQAFQGQDVWRLGREGVWSRELFEAALKRTSSRVQGQPEDLVEEPVLFLVNYRDGLKGRILICNGLLRSWVFGAYKKGNREVISTDCRIQFHLNGHSLEGHHHWGFMAQNFENLVISNQLPNPVERTFLTTGILAFCIDSLYSNNEEIQTPELHISYQV